MAKSSTLGRLVWVGLGKLRNVGNGLAASSGLCKPRVIPCHGCHKVPGKSLLKRVSKIQAASGGENEFVPLLTQEVNELSPSSVWSVNSPSFTFQRVL